MSVEALQQLVCDVSLEYFDRPFEHQARFNHRLKTTGGRYLLNTHDLEFNPKIIHFYGQDVLTGIIKHELCHYHLHLMKKGYRHQDTEFKNLLKDVDGLRYTPRLHLEAPKYTIECQICHRLFYRKKKQQLSKYRCPCGGMLEYVSLQEKES